MSKREKILWGFIIGSVGTYALAYWLLRDGHPLEAAEVIVVSPFPCPPGMPC